MSEKVHILDTAFYQYLKQLSVNDRTEHLVECWKASGEMFYELAEYYQEYNPAELSQLIEKGSV